MSDSRTEIENAIKSKTEICQGKNNEGNNLDFAIKLIEILLTKVLFGILKLLFYTIPVTIFRLIFHGAKRAKKKALELSYRPVEAGEIPPKEISSLSPQGFIFGRNLGYYLIKPEEQDGHILVIGGAGSGKTSCLTIPTLLSWQKRVFVIDVKGNLYDKTKAKRHNVKIFNPIDINACGNCYRNVK
ncbi:MAG: type IV secretory system conjugative DNA transfer family protein [Oscillospiraceae bacterium]|nr:type IV secretory system conjugative DNA transfer family protein [Oscillospiraceae bacterium]